MQASPPVDEVTLGPGPDGPLGDPGPPPADEPLDNARGGEHAPRMTLLLLLVGGAAGGLAVCAAATKTIRNPWRRTGVLVVAFFAPWYAFVPALTRLYPAEDASCSFFCISDGAFYGLVSGVGWCAGIVA